MQPRLPTFADIVAAHARLEPHLVATPLIEHPALNARTEGRVLLKCENLQRVGAFKFRGAYNKIAQVDRARFPGGVVACSSGNHAQGVAAAASLLGMRSAIVMPSDAPELKIARTRAFGGEVIGYDREREDRDAIARRICEERKAAYVHPYDDPDVMAGQGTAGLEIMQQADAIGAVPDAVLVCASGGGLVGGIAVAVKERNPATEVYSVEPEGFDDLARSLASGKRERNERLSGSLCDALLMPTPGEIPFEVAKRLLEGGLAVSDQEACAAVRFAFEELKLVLEPGGAVALAAVLSGRLPVRGRTIAVVLSGGNVDPRVFSDIICGR
ncbi:MAG TPA: threonine/serine dehydratase [Hyphomicrobiaceae bacterium]|nr:threonine/serine dehydratase [Hyphomicrobiaceae bacterium]